MHSFGNHIAIELIGTDRPGLLSEIFAVLANQHCNVVAAEVWTHKMRVACVIYINDEATSESMKEPSRMSTMEEQLRNVLRGCGDDVKGSCTSFSIGSTHVDRRLHQIMLADKDYEGYGGAIEEKDDMLFRPVITVDQCEDKVVTEFCWLRYCSTDYHAKHGLVIAQDGYKKTTLHLQELYIRHKDGKILDSKDEKERVIKCLEAAILRRVSEGFSLEICARDRVGLLSDVTRVLREYGLSVLRADVTTIGEKAMNVFYVSDPSGNPVDMKTIEALRHEIGHTVMLNVKRVPSTTKSPETSGWAKTSFSFGNLFGKFLS
ncbi:hypothetical protein GW17_00000899 [Ensete ventricosum]|nr:hypothetical protein GW17_00000899 [Ensete ventricosum]